MKLDSLKGSMVVYKSFIHEALDLSTTAAELIK